MMMVHSLSEIRAAAERMASTEKEVFAKDTALGAQGAKASQRLAAAIIPMPDFRHLEIQARKAYLAPWLKESAIIQVAGWRGSGKTMWQLSNFDALSWGKNFGPWTCTDPVKCCFVDGEMPPGDIIERAALLDIGKSPNFYIYSDAWASEQGLPRASLVNPDWRNEIKAILIDKQIQVVAFDNVASLAPGLDENSRKDWDPINQWLLELRFAKITSILLHHVGKNGTQRGTSGREDNLDCSIMLTQPADYQAEDGARFVVSFTKSRVAHADLHLIQDTEFKLTADDGGQYVWTWAPVRQQARAAIIEMLDQGAKQNEVVEVLGVTKGYVSKVRTKAIKDGLLSEKNKLTMDGFQALKGGKF